MLYINSISNQKASIGRKFAICHEKIEGIPNVLELTPSRELLGAYRSKKISFEEFAERFKRQMRAEYRKPQNRLKGLAEYSIKNDVTLHSPEENSEDSYRSILAEIINGIWRSLGINQTVIDLTISREIETPEVERSEIPQIVEEAEVIEEMEPETRHSNIPQINDIAEECEFFSPQNSEDKRVSCILCQYYDGNIYACNKENKLLVDYHWEESKSE
ncbi:TPA: hypothetical protein EYP66_14315 [Candidatus Poribacteria bacterium]|nr:hypothetical protein [Candidatus Poribacteria bacterium]